MKKIKLCIMLLAAFLVFGGIAAPVSTYANDFTQLYENPNDPAFTVTPPYINNLDSEGWGMFCGSILLKNNDGVTNFVKNCLEEHMYEIEEFIVESDVTDISAAGFDQLPLVTELIFRSSTPPVIGESLKKMDVVWVYVPDDAIDAYAQFFPRDSILPISERKGILSESLFNDELYAHVNDQTDDEGNDPTFEEETEITPSTQDKPSTQSKPSTKAPAKTVKLGSKKTIGKGVYKVTGKAAVQFVKPKKKTYTAVNIPKTVKISGKTFKVTAIGAKAFYNNKKLGKVTIPVHVTKIGAQAFAKTPKMRTIKVDSKKIKSVGAKAFAKTGKGKLRVSVPKAKKKAYKKLFVKRGLIKTAIR